MTTGDRPSWAEYAIELLGLGLAQANNVPLLEKAGSVRGECRLVAPSFACKFRNLVSLRVHNGSLLERHRLSHKP